ncbi:hypothetical protein [Hymenobacter elongatus]|uniref:Curlin n=1 Tax=Hymenobacter elongatus TaxID=877208 RepID=A0A4Z0PQF1_9BACT|nr:hypothetical protein [Hymenobacter elongatus]TGE18631.1 hypothetical protein E5J99_04820 [Hymenobacter elongatus]
MKTVLGTFLLVALSLASHGAWAQASRDPEDISTGQLLQQRLGVAQASSDDASSTNPANRATLMQYGSANRGSIDQRMIGVGQGNAAIITQDGMSNVAAILQTGSGSRTSISQIGVSNIASSELRGYNAESDITQKGYNNRVDQRLNVDDRRYTVEQMGSNNTLVQRESGSTAPGYEVSMKGNGIRIIVEQGRVSSLP